MIHFLLAVQLLFYVNRAILDMFQSPDSHSEVVSQAYFSEEVEILERQQPWIKIRTVTDQYTGWVWEKDLYQRDTVFFSPENSENFVKVNRFAAHLYKEPSIKSFRLTIPFDSQLLILESLEERWLKVELVNGLEGYIQKGDVISSSTILDASQIGEFSLQFLGLPYTWGGRSSFGYDCSGFVQMLYRQMGIFLPRDSKDQVNWSGFQSVLIEELQSGDLIFFGDSEDRISHVGMSLGNGQFIHATVAENAPYIHKSNLSDPEWNGISRYRCGRRLFSNN